MTQENIFLGTLTVKETIAYTAHLRLSSEMTKAEIDEVVETIIKEMGLGDCAENKIGNWHLRGISSGEKKRLSISLEMVTDPLILLLDEPTTGLDSASAFFVARALRNIADEGRIVICSVHQPSSEVFDLFDDLLLLSSGETVFLGEAKMAIEVMKSQHFILTQRHFGCAEARSCNFNSRHSSLQMLDFLVQGGEIPPITFCGVLAWTSIL